MLPDHRDWLGRGSIESRSPILLPIGSVEASADPLPGSAAFPYQILATCVRQDCSINNEPLDELQADLPSHGCRRFVQRVERC